MYVCIVRADMSLTQSKVKVTASESGQGQAMTAALFRGFLFKFWSPSSGAKHFKLGVHIYLGKA